MNSIKNVKEKECERIFDCWYKDVCSNECSAFCVRYKEMRYLVDSSGIPTSKQYPDILEAPKEDYDSFIELADIKSNICEWVGGFNNLYIASENTGNGKTSWSIKLLLKYFNEIWPGNGFKVRGIFVHVPTLLLQMKNFQNPVSEQYKEDLMNCDLVVWDEIASTSISAYDYSNLLMFMENRLMNGKSNIFTSNAVHKEQLEEIIGIKLASRIWNGSKLIFFKGKDRRQV